MLHRSLLGSRAIVDSLTTTTLPTLRREQVRVSELMTEQYWP